MKNLKIFNIRWKNLFFEENSPLVVDNSFSELVEFYSESHRHYHTLSHIEACLNWFDKVKDNLNDPMSCELAIWFHDVIYEPKRSDNEEKSADYSQKVLLNLNTSPHTIKTVYDLILLTKHPSQPTTTDEKYLLDIDLSILGSDSSLYLEYEKWIRKEYAYAPSFLYKRGRRKVLQGFLDQPSIYHTDIFKQSLEAQARDNLTTAINNLG
ncbi:MAG: hypothetical protein K6L73_10030 [Cellvibrionaceae bacterium]